MIYVKEAREKSQKGRKENVQNQLNEIERGLTVAENIIQDVKELEQGYQDELF